MPGRPTSCHTDQPVDRFTQPTWPRAAHGDVAAEAKAAVAGLGLAGSGATQTNRAKRRPRPAAAPHAAEVLGTTPPQRADPLQALALELTLAEQRERQRLARLLHDHLQQLLYAAKLSLAALRRRAGEPTFRAELAQIDELVDECLEESRSLTVELSPPILAHAGLAAALEWLARRTTEKYRLPVTIDIDPRAEPDREETRLLLFDAARELLFNVVKHARAAAAHLVLRLTAARDIELEVADNGAGFDAAARGHAAAPRGFGLFNVGRRLQGWGGAVRIDSAPGRGTRATISLPRQDAAPQPGARP